GEGAAAKVEHPCPLDPAIPHQGDVGGPAADVDEDAAGLVDLVDGARPGDRVGLRHRSHKLQVELDDHRLDGPDVGQRREGVEDRDVEVVALEAEWVGDGVAVDPHAGDCRV